MMTIDNNLLIEKGSNDTLDQFCDGLYRFTRYSTFRELSGLDPNLNPSIVSSIEFDNEGEFFALGGLSMNIKVYCLGVWGGFVKWCIFGDFISIWSTPQIFNYYSVIKTMGVANHLPKQEIACTAR